MSILVSAKTSGFGKWAEIHQPEKIAEPRNGGNESAILLAADADQAEKLPKQQPHRPWLVPGTGRL